MLDLAKWNMLTWWNLWNIEIFMRFYLFYFQYYNIITLHEYLISCHDNVLYKRTKNTVWISFCTLLNTITLLTDFKTNIYVFQNSNSILMKCNIYEYIYIYIYVHCNQPPIVFLKRWYKLESIPSASIACCFMYTSTKLLYGISAPS